MCYFVTPSSYWSSALWLTKNNTTKEARKVSIFQWGKLLNRVGSKIQVWLENSVHFPLDCSSSCQMNGGPHEHTFFPVVQQVVGSPVLEWGTLQLNFQLWYFPSLNHSFLSHAWQCGNFSLPLHTLSLPGQARAEAGSFPFYKCASNCALVIGKWAPGEKPPLTFILVWRPFARKEVRLILCDSPNPHS